MVSEQNQKPVDKRHRPVQLAESRYEERGADALIGAGEARHQTTGQAPGLRADGHRIRGPNALRERPHGPDSSMASTVSGSTRTAPAVEPRHYLQVSTTRNATPPSAEYMAT